MGHRLSKMLQQKAGAQLRSAPPVAERQGYSSSLPDSAIHERF